MSNPKRRHPNPDVSERNARGGKPPPPTLNPNVGADDQEPCCSKSIAKNSPQHVHSEAGNKKQGPLVQREVSFSEPPILPHRPHSEPIRGLALSDTVLAMSNLPEFERAHTYDEYRYPFNPAQAPSAKDSDESLSLSSNANSSNPLYNISEDRSSIWEFLNSDGLWENKTFNVVKSKSAQSRFSLNNNNEVKGCSESKAKLLENASYLFDIDRGEQVKKALNLFPRGREFVVFTVFSDMARAMRYKYYRRRHVKFPLEVVREYEEKGDVAGKDRFVPFAKQPYKGLGISATSKKKRLSAVYSPCSVKETEFYPRVERIDDYGKCEHWCERKLIACECCCSSGEKPDLTNVMEGFFSDLNLASFFLHSHLNRTFDSALATVELVQFEASLFSSIEPEVKRVGLLTTGIWLFGYSIRTIVAAAASRGTRDPDKLVSEAGFRKVMEQFAAICLATSEKTKIILQYARNFYNFSKECIRIMKVLQVHVGFPAKFSLKKPIRRGDGLKLAPMKIREIVEEKALMVKVARSKPATEAADDSRDWTNFEELPGKEKIYCLRHLLHVTSDGTSLVQTQLRFLLDDIVDSVKDIAEADLLFLLADIYDRVKFLGNVDKKQTKIEMEEVSHLLADFCRDFQAFVDLSQHILKRYIEFRDAVHLTYDYIVFGLKVDMLAEMLPGDIFKPKRRGWCGSQPSGRRKKKKKKKLDKYFPKYKVSDFFRVYYSDAVPVDIDANRYHFQLGWNTTGTLKVIVPEAVKLHWGAVEIVSPRASLDEYLDSDYIDDEAVDFKPILVVGSSSSDEESPAKPAFNPKAQPVKGVLSKKKQKFINDVGIGSTSASGGDQSKSKPS